MYGYVVTAWPEGSGGEHSWDECSRKGAALTEGWAAFFQAWAQYLVWEMYGGVRDDNYQDWSTSGPGVIDDLEEVNPNTRCTLSTGAEGEYESQAAGTFWDLHDGNNDNQWPTDVGSDALSWYGPEIQRALKEWEYWDGSSYRQVQNMADFHYAFDAEVCCPDTTVTHELFKEHDLYYDWGGPH